MNYSMISSRCFSIIRGLFKENLREDDVIFLFDKVIYDQSGLEQVTLNFFEKYLYDAKSINWVRRDKCWFELLKKDGISIIRISKQECDIVDVCYVFKKREYYGLEVNHEY